MEMHLPAGRLLGLSCKHPAAVLQSAQVECLKDRVSTAVLVATSAARMVGNCMVKVFGVGGLDTKETGC
jgi:hypothetical protein